MGKTLTMVLLAGLLAAATLLGPTSEARCQIGCLPTFCGTSGQCPGDCVCAIPFGEATGHCTGTR